MVEAIERFSTRSCQSAHHSPAKGSTEQDCPWSDTRFRSLDNPLRTTDRLPVCQESALPILRLHRVVGSFPTMAKWTPPRVDLRNLHGAGMGLECVPKHGSKLDGGCWLLGGDSRQYVDRHQPISHG